MKARALVIMAILGILLVSVVCVTSGADGAYVQPGTPVNENSDGYGPLAPLFNSPIMSPLIWLAIGGIFLILGFLTGQPIVKGIGITAAAIGGLLFMFNLIAAVITYYALSMDDPNIIRNTWIFGPYALGVLGLLFTMIGAKTYNVPSKVIGAMFTSAMFTVILLQIMNGDCILYYPPGVKI